MFLVLERKKISLSPRTWRGSVDLVFWFFGGCRLDGLVFWILWFSGSSGFSGFLGFLGLPGAGSGSVCWVGLGWRESSVAAERSLFCVCGREIEAHLAWPCLGEGCVPPTLVVGAR